MTCQEVQLSLSLYLYGELEFAKEEELERHLDECALCERALAREKAWHTAANAEKKDTPLDLLASCRQTLRNTIHLPRTGVKAKSILWQWTEQFGFSPSGWSFRLAVASFLVVIGFSLGQFVDRYGHFDRMGAVSEMGLLNPERSHVRDIEPGNDGNIRIILDQVQERQVIGQVDSAPVRRLLLAATKDAADPGVQVDSVNILKNQGGDDVRNALLDVAQHDGNAGVRLKALEALQERFAGDSAARQGITFVLEHDDNPGVRSQAIDFLVPLTAPVEFNPELANTLEQVMRSQQDDDYVHMRCVQVLREMGAPVNIY